MSAAPVFLEAVDLVAEGTRPAGQPGSVNRQHRHPGWEYPAVQTPAGTVLFWRDTQDSAGRWIVAPARLAASFVAGPEWQASCTHLHHLPWQTCDSEADCAALDREHERTWGR